MSRYTIVFSKPATKDLRNLPNAELQKIYSKIKLLEEDPRPDGCKKLSGEKEDLWRIRIGDYRVIYSIDDKVTIVDIRRIGHRREIYDR